MFAWLIGNTGLRNPMRIYDGFSAFSNSSFVGNLHGRERELDFEKFLIKNDIIHRNINAKSDGTYARKWKLLFVKFGLIYDKYKKDKGFEDFEGFHRTDEITPFGRIFLKADTLPAIEECFLRAMTVKQVPLIDNKEKFFSPLGWILAIMLELEKRTGSSELTKIEFIIYGQKTDPSFSLNETVDKILVLREKRKKAPSKRVFDKNEIKKAYKTTTSVKDYCDMNMRYLRMTGIIQRKGQGLRIIPTKHVIAEEIASVSVIGEKEKVHQIQFLTTCAPLPTDNKKTAMKALAELEKELKSKHVFYDISDNPLDTVNGINRARFKLEDILAQTDEIVYASKQREQWREIADYMGLLIQNKTKSDYKDEDEDKIIEIPKDEQAIYLEWIIWRAMLAIDSLKNKPYEVRGFKLDADFFPVSTAAGGRGDLYCDFDNYLVLTEVTMSTSSRQESMEGEPVRRHVSNAEQNYKKPVYGLFIAKRIDLNTAETFRHGIWYASKQKTRLTILPLDLEHFRKCFVDMFESDNVSPDHIISIIQKCEKERDILEAPEWIEYINKQI